MPFKIEFNTPHLAQGSKCPKKPGEKMVLYNMRYCPFAQRSVLVLLAKDLPFKLVNVNLKSKPEWFIEKHPYGAKVPVLEINDQLVRDSLIVIEYLDEKFPEKKLFPDNLEAKARDREFLAYNEKVYMPFYKLGGASNAEERDEVIQQIYKGIDIYEKELSRRGTKFFLGNEFPGLLDYGIWPHFERLFVIGLKDTYLPSDRFKLMNKWIEDMKTDPAVKSYLLSESAHMTFFEGMKNGNPNYDALTTKQG